MVYLKQFEKNNTRYVWVELKIKNKFKIGWNVEYFVNIFDDAGQPKAIIREFQKVDVSKNNAVYFYTGWGSEKGGSWFDDKYSVNIVFMDTLVASTSFTIGEKAIKGVPELITGGFKTPIQIEVEDSEQEHTETLEELLAKLDELIGLQSIKKQIKDHLNYLEFLKIRRTKGFKENEKISLHSVFTGNPGTGKTTVVKMLGKIYKELGLLSKGHVYEVDRSVLVGEFIGQTAPRTKKAIEEARGGILFIDEAYALYREGEDKKDFGLEVIEVLIKEMSDGPGDIAIMFAGYPKEMETFINSNPGLKSRVSSFFHFPDYTPDELVEIAKYAANKKGLIISKDAMTIIRKVLVEAYRNRDETFGNARFAHSLIDTAKMNMGLRLVKNKNLKKLTKKELSTIEKVDVEPMLINSTTKKINIEIDNELLAEAMAELNELIGLEKIKTDVNELAKLVRYYREIGRDVLNAFSLHAVFTGNPGTGKTTVARIIGKIYKALGLLERGHVVETDREGLIAEFLGQTAVKTKEMIDKAMGGVLFIDEAYGLTSNRNSYGSEAIEVILKNMEDHRGKFAVIVAGYPDNMDEFLKTNPGLMSRFDKTMHFRDFTVDELLDIVKLMLSRHKLELDKQAEEYLKNYIAELHKNRDKYFGNAREMRKITEDVARKQNLRMADMPAEERTIEAIRTVTLQDVKHLKIQQKQGKSFGFGA
jgi:SpoVK/Ycf46/Vps4 family AAA+-type ATPase